MTGNSFTYSELTIIEQKQIEILITGSKDSNTLFINFLVSTIASPDRNEEERNMTFDLFCLVINTNYMTGDAECRIKKH